MTRIDLGVVLYVARLHEVDAELRRQRLHAFLDQALDGAEAERRPFAMERLRDAPGDRMVVRDSEDQPLASVKQTHAVTLPS